MPETPKAKPYLDLSWAMLKTGILGYGGGPSVIPLIRHEAVTRYKWMSDEEFGEILAFANALPGPIATKIAAYLGYRLKKSAGAAVAILAHILPSAIAMIALLSVVNVLSQSPIIQGMIGAVIPVIAVMLGMMAYEFGERTVKGSGKAVGFIFFLLAFGLLQLLDIHPAAVIVLFLLYGAFHYKLAGWLKKRRLRKAGRTNETEKGSAPWNG